MTRPVLAVDASVVVKWILPEPDRLQARRLQDLYQAEKLDLIAPDIVVSEVGNALWKHVRRAEITAAAADRSFEQFLRDAPLLFASAGVARSSFALALAHQHPIYDCLYLALALEQRCDLVTADEKFCRAVHPAFACLHLLRDFEPAGFSS